MELRCPVHYTPYTFKLTSVTKLHTLRRLHYAVRTRNTNSRPNDARSSCATDQLFMIESAACISPASLAIPRPPAAEETSHRICAFGILMVWKGDNINSAQGGRDRGGDVAVFPCKIELEF